MPSISKVPYGWYRFNISFPCGLENVDKLTNATLAEFDKLIKEGPSDKDLAKVKEAQLLGYKENLKENRFWLQALKNADYEQTDASKMLDFEKTVNAMTKEDLQKVAKKYLNNGYIIGIQNPEKS